MNRWNALRRMIEQELDAIWMSRKVAHRGYSATNRQVGHIYEGWRIVKRYKIPWYLRWYYDGKTWPSSASQ